MASFLQGPLRKAIAAGFRNQLIQGTLLRQNASSTNEYGDVVATPPSSFTVSGFHDQYDEKYRVAAGIPETDSKLTLILGNCQTDPIKDDTITLIGYPAFKVRKIRTDPAKATAECQVFEIF